MALLFMDGFDHYDPQSLDAQGEPWLARGKAAFLSQMATRIQGRRPHSFGLRIPAGAHGGYVKNLVATSSSLIVGCALRVPPYDNTAGIEPVLLGVRDTSSMVVHVVKLADDARLKLYRGVVGEQWLSTSISSAPVRGWHYVELQLIQHAITGSAQVRVNGVLAIHVPNLNTLQGGGPLVSAFVGAVPGQPCPVTLDIDDLYLADTSGTLNNTFLGDCRVDVLLPNRAGSLNQFATSPGTLAAWQALADTDETTLIRAATPGMRTTVGCQALPVMTTPVIHGVQLNLLAAKDDAGAANLKGVIISGTSQQSSAAHVLQEQAVWHSPLFERNPNGNLAWTESALNAAEFGVEMA